MKCMRPSALKMTDGYTLRNIWPDDQRSYIIPVWSECTVPKSVRSKHSNDDKQRLSDETHSFFLFCFELIGGFLDGEIDITGLGLQSCHCYDTLPFYHSQLLFFFFQIKCIFKVTFQSLSRITTNQAIKAFLLCSAANIWFLTLCKIWLLFKGTHVWSKTQCLWNKQKKCVILCTISFIYSSGWCSAAETPQTAFWNVRFPAIFSNVSLFIIFIQGSQTSVEVSQ